jgi:hypothetical protein
MRVRDECAFHGDCYGQVKQEAKAGEVELLDTKP